MPLTKHLPSSIRERHPDGVITQAEVEDELIRYSDLLLEGVLEYGRLAEDESDKAIELLKQEATEGLKLVEGTVPEKAQRVFLKTIDAYKAHATAAHMLKTQSKLNDYYSKTQEALRTLAANARSQYG